MNNFPRLPYDTPGRMYHPDEWCAHCGRPFRKHATRALAAEHIARVVASERGVSFDLKTVGGLNDVDERDYERWVTAAKAERVAAEAARRRAIESESLDKILSEARVRRMLKNPYKVDV